MDVAITPYSNELAIEPKVINLYLLWSLGQAGLPVKSHDDLDCVVLLVEMTA